MLNRRRIVFFLTLALVLILAALEALLTSKSDPTAADPITHDPTETKILFGGIATGALVLAWIAVGSIFRRLNGAIDRWHAPIHQALKIQRLEVVSAQQIRDAMLSAARLARSGILLVTLSIYISRILSLFPEAGPVANELRLMVINPLNMIGQAVIDYLPNLIQIIIILLITRYALKLIHLFFHAIDAGIIVIPDFYPDWSEPTYKIVRLVVLVFIPFAILPLLPGANSQFFEEISFFIGLLVSLGSTSAIKNMTAGMVLTYTRSFQIGDRIRIGESVGDVLDKSLFVTRLNTIKNEQITIPNGTVLDSNIVNYSTQARTQGLILHTSVTIGYDVDWRQVHDLLIAAALRTTHIIETPQPFVLQTSLDDYYVAYEINAYTSRADLMAGTLSELHQNIQDSFHTAGVEIMSPAYTALRNGSDAAIPAQEPPVTLPHRASPASPEEPPPPHYRAPLNIPVYDSTPHR